MAAELLTIGGQIAAPIPQDEDALNLRALFMTLWRRKMVVIGTALIFTSISVLVVNQLVSLYVAEAQVVVEPPRTNVVDIESVAPGLSTDWFTQETQAAILGSRLLAGKVIDRLKPSEKNALFDPTPRPPTESWWERLGIDEYVAEYVPEEWLTTVQDFSDEWLVALRDFRAVEETGDAQPVALSPAEQRRQLRDQRIDAYLGQLAIVPSDSSRVITVRVTSPVRELAATLANAAAQVYIDDQVDTKSDQTELANAWLEDRAIELKRRVEGSARAMEKHRRTSGLINVEGSSLLAQQIAELNSRLIVARAELAESEARYAQVQKLLRAEGGIESAAAVLQSTLIQRLREQEAEVLRNIAELKTQLRESHPKMILARNELTDLVAKIKTEVRKIVTNLGNELEISRVRVTNLQREVNRLQGRLDSQTDAEITLRALETELEANQKLYDTILARLKETGVQDASLVQADARIISYATVPRGPSFPRKKMIVITAFVAATVLGIFLVMLLEHLDSGFRSREQLEAVTGLTALGVVPFLKVRRFGGAPPYDDILERPNTAFSESFRMLRTALMLSNIDRPPRCVLVTSSIPGEGKSTIALALARIAAKQGQKSIIIDADLRHPGMHEAFDVPNDVGLIDYLGHDMSLEEIVQIDFKSGAHFVLAGQTVPHAIDLLGSERMCALLVSLRNVYDLIVIDTPPVLALSDTLVLLRYVDKTVFLVRWEKTRRETLLAGVRQVLDAGADLAGIVLTQVDMRKQAQYPYGSAYYGTYHSAYRKYYSG